MGNYFNELRWKIIRANNLLQLIHQVTIEIRFRKSLAQERFKSNLEFRNQIKVSSIKFWKCFAKFMIPIALFKKFLSFNSGWTDIDRYIQDIYRMPGAREPEKQHTNAQVTFIHQTYISGGIRSKFWTYLFKTCQRIRPDKTDITWHGTHSPQEELTRKCMWTDREFYCLLRLC